jgi:hypothetical protein
MLFLIGEAARLIDGSCAAYVDFGVVLKRDATPQRRQRPD